MVRGGSGAGDDIPDLAVILDRLACKLFNGRHGSQEKTKEMGAVKSTGADN